MVLELLPFQVRLYERSDFEGVVWVGESSKLFAGVCVWGGVKTPLLLYKESSKSVQSFYKYKIFLIFSSTYLFKTHFQYFAQMAS